MSFRHAVSRISAYRRHGGIRPRDPDETLEAHLAYLRRTAVGGAGHLAEDVLAVVQRLEQLESRVAALERA